MFRNKIRIRTKVDIYIYRSSLRYRSISGLHLPIQFAISAPQTRNAMEVILFRHRYERTFSPFSIYSILTDYANAPLLGNSSQWVFHKTASVFRWSASAFHKQLYIFQAFGDSVARIVPDPFPSRRLYSRCSR